MKDYEKCARELLEFIEESPSSFHVVENIRGRLNGEGFTELKEGEEWEIVPGGRYYVIRNGSSIIAFCIPRKQEIAGFHIVASHSDSPSFKVKEGPEITVEESYVKLNTEKYGGMILSTWLDRPLSVAGRVAVCPGKTSKIAGDIIQDRISTKLVNIQKDLLVIPNVAIHMNRDMNKGVEYNPQVDMLPLFADCAESEGSGALSKMVAEAVGVKKEDILGHDLFLYVREKGRILGENGEFILSPRLDDLQCVFASCKAFMESVPERYINLCAVFDNEEVGSGTGQGADSTFLEDVLSRISESLMAGEGMGQYPDGQGRKSRLLRWIADSFLISADNAHAVHPNHPEKADPTNRPYLNRGIVIKYHGSQKYATDAVSAARMKEICHRAKVPCQSYANRSDIPGGSTLGNISTAHVSVSSVDIGLPQLAMHSAVETAGARDTLYAVQAFRTFFAE
ncbi:MAG: M18 family aminopeptidase [Lachnospiraceae bacterium]|nr:M18 family aminopeptidase [Lachnospiraceae bacterium]